MIAVLALVVATAIAVPSAKLAFQWQRIGKCTQLMGFSVSPGSDQVMVVFKDCPGWLSASSTTADVLASNGTALATVTSAHAPAAHFHTAIGKGWFALVTTQSSSYSRSSLMAVSLDGATRWSADLETLGYGVDLVTGTADGRLLFWHPYRQQFNDNLYGINEAALMSSANAINNTALSSGRDSIDDEPVAFASLGQRNAVFLSNSLVVRSVPSGAAVDLNKRFNISAVIAFDLVADPLLPGSAVYALIVTNTSATVLRLDMVAGTVLSMTGVHSSARVLSAWNQRLVVASSDQLFVHECSESASSAPWLTATLPMPALPVPLALRHIVDMEFSGTSAEGARLFVWIDDAGTDSAPRQPRLLAIDVAFVASATTSEAASTASTPTTHVSPPTTDTLPDGDVACGSVTLPAQCKTRMFSATFQLPSGNGNTATQQRFEAPLGWKGGVSSFCGGIKRPLDQCGSRPGEATIQCPRGGISVNGQGGSQQLFFAKVSPPANATDCSGVVRLTLGPIFKQVGQCVVPLTEVATCTDDIGPLDGSRTFEPATAVDVHRAASVIDLVDVWKVPNGLGFVLALAVGACVLLICLPGITVLCCCLAASRKRKAAGAQFVRLPNGDGSDVPPVFTK